LWYIFRHFFIRGTLPDGIISLDDKAAFGLAEVNCPFKHRKSTIEEACNDALFDLWQILTMVLCSKGYMTTFIKLLDSWH